MVVGACACGRGLASWHAPSPLLSTSHGLRSRDTAHGMEPAVLVGPVVNCLGYGDMHCILTCKYRQGHIHTCHRPACCRNFLSSSGPNASAEVGLAFPCAPQPSLVNILTPCSESERGLWMKAHSFKGCILFVLQVAAKADALDAINIMRRGHNMTKPKYKQVARRWHKAAR